MGLIFIGTFLVWMDASAAEIVCAQAMFNIIETVGDFLMRRWFEGCAAL